MIALVTGASRGIGRAIALRLAQDGIDVAVNYRTREDEARTAVDAILQKGARAVAIQADTSDAAQVARLVEQAESQLGPIDILVNNAAILIAGDIDRFDPLGFDAMFRTNVEGTIHTIRAVAPGMRTRRSGRIVNLSSIAAAGTAAAGTTYYAATKGAVETLTRRFALELGPSGIRVNAVAPGFILTDMVDPMASPAQRETLISAMASKAVLRRIGTPGDIASAVAFLVSDEASFITGQILTVDGGRTDFLSR